MSVHRVLSDRVLIERLAELCNPVNPVLMQSESESEFRKVVKHAPDTWRLSGYVMLSRVF